MKELVTKLEQEVKKINNLLDITQNRLKALEDWKKARERQQITNPLDDASQIIIDNRRIKT